VCQVSKPVTSKSLTLHIQDTTTNIWSIYLSNITHYTERHKYIHIFLEWMSSLSSNKYINNVLVHRWTLQSLIQTTIHSLCQ